MIELKISGMTCGHCAAHVEEELTALAGVSNIKVDLNPQGISSVVFQAAAPLSDTEIYDAIAEAGDYKVEEIIHS